MVEKLESLIESKYDTALQNGSLFFFETETESKSEAGIEVQRDCLSSVNYLEISMEAALMLTVYSFKSHTRLLY